jgi:hypothetical protein
VKKVKVNVKSEREQEKRKCAIETLYDSICLGGDSFVRESDLIGSLVILVN